MSEEPKEDQVMSDRLLAGLSLKVIKSIRASVEDARKLDRYREEIITSSLHAGGFKPYKRIDRRNRPLRTKRSWISLRARHREHEIVTLKFRDGLTFREIGKRIGISHVAAWKRFRWAMQEIWAEQAYRARCMEEIRWRMAQVDKMEPQLEGLSIQDRRRKLIACGLIVKPAAKRRDATIRNAERFFGNHNG